MSTIKIKEFKIDESIQGSSQWFEVTWSDEVDGNEVTVHCESFSDHPEHIELLRKRAESFGTSLDEYEELIATIEVNRYVPTAEEVAEAEELANVERIKMIKAIAAEKITARYPIIWQLNHPRADEAYKLDYEWIDAVRAISNEAELAGTKVEDIKWEL